MITGRIHTPLGIAYLEADKEGIVHAISIQDEKGTGDDNKIPKELEIPARQLSEYFKGSRTQFDFPIHLNGTAFQKRVWNELLKIPFGKTWSYTDLTRRLGDMKAIRAVASANGKNPLWIVVPCHRVIGADGSLTGYAGGLWRKKWLLEHETPTQQTSLF